ncbi:hypothetical protein [Kribbella sp. NPDC051718]|uniref:hypothetical protein n=1 Tax=Kribbella sp. NPDC051718 TaxID=3155168 RepID=UPI0034416CC7
MSEQQAWRDHLPLLLSITLPLLSVLQVAALTGYDLNLTAAILSSSAGNTVGTLIRALLFALPLCFLIFGFGLSAGAISVRLVFGREIWRQRPKWIDTPRQYLPIWAGLTIVTIMLAPWTYLLMGIATFFILFLLFAIGLLVYRAYLGGQAATRPQSTTGDQLPHRQYVQAFAVAYFLSIWLMAGGNWAPYEALANPSNPGFTGRVMGTEGDQIVVLTSGRRHTITRLPIGATKRTLCMPTRANEGSGNFSLLPKTWGQQNDYARSLPQLLTKTPKHSLSDCPTRNAP